MGFHFFVQVGERVQSAAEDTLPLQARRIYNRNRNTALTIYLSMEQQIRKGLHACTFKFVDICRLQGMG